MEDRKRTLQPCCHGIDQCFALGMDCPGVPGFAAPRDLLEQVAFGGQSQQHRAK